MSSFLVAVITCCAGLTGALTPAPAAAASKSWLDPRGDADQTRHDMRRIKIGNTPAGVTLRVKVRALRPARRPQVTSFLIRHPVVGFVARSVRRGDGTVVTRLNRNDGTGPPESVPCPKSSEWRLRADIVSIWIDQACLSDEPETIVANVAIGWGTGLADAPSDTSRVVIVKYD
jgi:hypothetical protein